MLHYLFSREFATSASQSWSAECEECQADILITHKGEARQTFTHILHAVASQALAPVTY